MQKSIRCRVKHVNGKRAKKCATGEMAVLLMTTKGFSVQMYKWPVVETILIIRSIEKHLEKSQRMEPKKMNLFDDNNNNNAQRMKTKQRKCMKWEKTTLFRSIIYVCMALYVCIGMQYTPYTYIYVISTLLGLPHSFIHLCMQYMNMNTIAYTYSYLLWN